MKSVITLITLGLALVIFTSTLSTSVQAADKKPNILVIFGDDIGQANEAGNKGK